MADLIDRIELMRQIAEFGREIPKDQVIGVIARQEAVETEGDIINRQAAIALLKRRLYETAMNNDGVPVMDAGALYADIAENRIELWMSEPPSIDRPKGEWTPVSENPKDEEKSYLVQLDGGGMCSCRWTNVNPFWTDLTTEWHWCIFDIPQYSKVVAWMDLEPYKGGEDE